MRITSRGEGAAGPFIDYDSWAGTGAALYLSVARAITFYVATGARNRELRRAWRVLQPGADAPMDPAPDVGRAVCDLVARAMQATDDALDRGVLDANPANAESETWYELLLDRIAADWAAAASATALELDEPDEPDPASAVSVFVADINNWLVHCASADSSADDDDDDDDNDDDSDDSDDSGGGGDN